MPKNESRTDNPPPSHISSKSHSPPRNLSKVAGDPYASVLQQHASQHLFEPPSPVSIALPTRYASVADRPIAEPSKSHQRTITGSPRSDSDLPPLISRSSNSGTPPTCQLPIIPQVDVAAQPSGGHPSPQQSRQSSPTRSSRFSVLTGKQEEKVGKLADWFKGGESEPISLGIIPSLTKEKSDPSDTAAKSSDIRPSNLLQRLSTAPVISKPAMASRFSFFSSKASLVKPTPVSNDLCDELLDMDVSAALFPNEPANPFSPASFKNLQQQAEGLLSRLQMAYKERTIALRDMTAEKETIAEESLGAETRAKHLKMQLDGMTAKFAEQDEAMMNLVDELAQEKQGRREDEEARKRTLRVVGDAPSPNSDRRGHRHSNTISDSGFESEDDSCADSVFSARNGAQSPNMSVSSASTANSPDVYRTHDFHMPPSTTQTSHLRLPYGQPALKGIPVHPYTNYEGNRASEAWSVVGILKEENEVLKHRIGELEGALDGCLDVVGRLS